jgi:hypothetical protein
MSNIKSNKNNKFYKMAQSIDSFSDYMPTQDVKRDLIDPVRQGRCTFEEIAQDVAQIIWENMNYSTNPKLLKEYGLVGKKKYYPEGNWINGRLCIDIKGKDKGLKDYIKDRLMNFECMLYEDYLMATLKELELFSDVKEAGDEMDRIYKIDLIAKDIQGTNFNISVYKSTDATALYKLNNSNVAIKYNNRLSYNVNKSGDPRDPENVSRWVDEIIDQGKHIIYRQNNSWKIS